MATPDNLEMSSDDEMMGKKFGCGKRNDAQPADSDDAESEASDKEGQKHDGQVRKVNQ